MKYDKLSTENQNRIRALELLGKERKKRARHGAQFKSDPKGTAKTAAVKCWEFDVDPKTWNAGAFRLVRRHEGSDVTWWWLEHAGDSKSFKKAEQITGIPSFKPVRETEEENHDRATPDHPIVVAVTSRIDATTRKDEDVPDNWEDS